MKIGISAFVWTANFDESHLGILPSIKRMGLEAIEIPMFDPAKIPILKIRDACRTHGLECTVCAILPKRFNPISRNPVVRQSAIRHLSKCLEATASLGAILLGGPLFAPIGYLPRHRPTEEEFAWAVEAFQAISEDVNRYGITVSIEPVNRSETFFMRTAADAMRLCAKIGNPRIGVTIDTFHANIEEKSIPAAIRGLGSYLKHIHVSENDRGMLGSGHIAFDDIVSALREIGYTGYLMIEGFGFSAGERTAPGWLLAERDISPEILAMHSTEYLTGLVKGSLA
jgi:D-psicose/D-tagatose/L-ribulose 3-epimerase